MSDISKAITAKQARITTLQADAEALQRAASLIGAFARGAQNKPTAKPTRSKMSAAARKAVSKRMKAYWAKKRTGKK